MAKKDEQTLPEEKLLKVIQGGDRGKKDTAAATAAATAAGGTAESTSATVASGKPSAPARDSETAQSTQGEKPVLKVDRSSATVASGKATTPARSSEAAQSTQREKPVLKVDRSSKPEKPAPAGKQEAAAQPVTPARVGKMIPVSPVRRHARVALSVGTVTPWLGVAAATMFFLTALEIGANFQRIRVDQWATGLPTGLPIPPREATAGTALGAGDAGNFVVFLVPPQGSGDDPTKPPVLTEWGQYVKEHVSLIGISRGGKDGEPEAILGEKDVDKKETKMHFLRLGQKITLAQKELTLERIGGEEAILSDGKQSLAVKPRHGKVEAGGRPFIPVGDARGTKGK